MPGVPIIGGGSSTATGPTLLRLRNLLADEIGFYEAAVVNTTATNAEAARVMIANELRDDEADYPFMGQWLYARTGVQAGSQRRLIAQDGVGYQGSKGALVVSRPFAAALVSGTVVEITNPLPVKRTGTIKGLNDCVNEGLALIKVAARLTFTGNATYEQSLAAYPWLTSIDQTRGIYDTLQAATGTPATLSPYPYHIVSNGVTRTLVTYQQYAASDTFYLDVVVRADRLVFDGSSWSYVTTPGLQGDTYQAAIPEEWIVPFGMVCALRELAKLIRADQQMSRGDKNDALTDNARQRARWATAARTIKAQQFPRPAPLPQLGLVSFTPIAV